MDTVQVYQGIGGAWLAQVPKADGTPAVGVYDGTEPLYGAVFQPATFTSPLFIFGPQWSDPGGGPLGKIDLLFPPASTVGVWPGRYRGLVAIDDFSQPLVEFLVDVIASPVAAPLNATAPFGRAVADYGLLQRIAMPFSKLSISLDATSPIGQFNDAFQRALSFLKIQTASPVASTDLDFAKVRRQDWQEMLDIAEAEMLAWGAATHTFAAAGRSDERWPDYSYRRDPIATQWLQKLATDRMASCQRLYGYNVPVLKYGAINLGFQANRKSHYAANRCTDSEVS